ncbi:MAG: hypothetical protein AAF743_14745, partial [Planctomycetota bacterium]
QRSVENANAGVEIGDEVAAVLSEIQASNDKVTGLVSEIAAASGEQAQGIEQVNGSMSQMDKVTQASAANAEESAAAAEELASQSETVNGLVDGLRSILGGGAAAPGMVDVTGSDPSAAMTDNTEEDLADFRSAA